MRWSFAVAEMIAILAIASFAHDGMKHIQGHVKSIAENTLTVQTTAGEAVTVGFNAQTKFEKSQAAWSAKQVKTGELVVVDVPENGKPVAIRVRFVAPAKADAHGDHKVHGQ
ncbi:MAG: hypothetical protein AB7O65_10480 [Candidatus Korobacteraceae bacterium]